jgi:glucan phosphoethanolaminetransferase (alkaline phosphatase superfamily)
MRGFFIMGVLTQRLGWALVLLAPIVFAYEYWTIARDDNLRGAVLFTLIVVLFCVSFYSLDLTLRASRKRAWIQALRVTARIGVMLVSVGFSSYCMIALLSWGNLPTLQLTLPYLRQLPQLLSSAGVSPALAALGALTLLVAVFFWAILDTRNKSSTSRFRFERVVIGFLADKARLKILLGALSAILPPSLLIIHLTASVDEHAREPILYFFNPPVGVSLQSLTVDLGEVKSRQRAALVEWEQYQPGTPKRQPNIILITVDALRPDRMHLVGANRNTTPFLSSLGALNAARSHDEARATCAESMCGLTSLLAGQSGHELSWRPFGLPSVLQKIGYKTVALYAGDHTNFYGLRDRLQGFDVFSDGTDSDTKNVNDDFALIERAKNALPINKTQPAFVHFHLMSAHLLGKKHPKYAVWQPTKSPFRLLIGEHSAQDLLEYENFYDNGVLQTDDIIRQIFEILRERGFLENSITLITADHGEFLGERGLFQHAKTLYEPVLRIPWIWLSSNAADLPNSLGRPAIQADYAPTIIDLLGLNRPRWWSGVSMYQRRHFCCSYHEQGRWAGLIDYSVSGRTIKYLVDRENGYSLAYNVSTDPREETNLIDSIPRDDIDRWNRLLRAERLLRPIVFEPESNGGLIRRAPPIP